MSVSVPEPTTKRVLIACRMLEDELSPILDNLPAPLPVVWIDRQLHLVPDNLKKHLAEAITRAEDGGAEEILLAFCLCGNGTEGLCTKKARLIIPRFDDCINMLLCPAIRDRRSFTELGTYYLTRGWTKDPNNAILQALDRIMLDYDHETAKELIDAIYGSYKKLALIDTGSYRLSSIREYAETVCSHLHLTLDFAEGSTLYLEKLLAGDWGDSFLVLAPGEPVRMRDFEYGGDSTPHCQ